MQGTVFNIQKFSINDGPGLRTTVFLKGCPLNCLWCHNPESKKAMPEIFFDRKKCTFCSRCAPACEKNLHRISEGEHDYLRSDCTACGKCTDSCLVGALEVTGKLMDSAEVIEEVMKDEIFYETSGGGMTLSGGEPLLQLDFSAELLGLAKERGLHTAMETSGYASREAILRIAPLVDLFLFDCKETDSRLHKEFTGVGNEKILENLRLLDSLGKDIVLRCPIIPGYNDRDEHFIGIAALAEELAGVKEINVEPYHPLGEGKSSLLGREYALSSVGFPSEESVADWISKIQSKTSKIVKKA